MQAQAPGADRESWREAPRFDEARIREVALRAALATSQRRLEEALSRIETLLARDSQHAAEIRALDQAVAKAHRFAYRDELTGLPNRRLLLDRFDQAAAQAQRQHQQVALLFLDIDGFKLINDRFGHAAGDSVLQQFAARLTQCIRQSDTACRPGGDEFVILLPAIENEGNIAAVTRKIRANLSAYYVVANTRIKVSASFGKAVYPVNGRTYGDLIKASDSDMYRSKQRGLSVPTAKEPQSITGLAP